jgi:spore coat polysaccharide biosynthesis predicted glycosyltransferase SpsG
VHRIRDGSIKRILIAFGGVDPNNATSLVFESLIKLNNQDISMDLIISNRNPHHDVLDKRCKHLSIATLYKQPANIAEIMIKADLAIGAAGMMMWERCCVGLPSLLISIAENQVKLSEYLDLIGVACFVGSLADIHIEKKLIDKVSFFLHHEDEVKRLGINSFNLMGNNGQMHRDSVVKAMMS